MKEHIELIEATKNRIQKRYRHLSKWAKGQGVHYFRVFDRDIPGVPVMIDSLPKHWLIWVCEHSLNPDDETSLLSNIQAALIALKDAKVIVKHRKKRNAIKQSHFQVDEETIVVEGGLKFQLNLTRYLDTGLFIDHRNTRDYLKTAAKGQRVLNLFAYTGSFSCYALAGGSNFVTSVDLNPTYSEWHKKNCELNGFSKNQYAIITSDVLQFLKTNKSKYDMIVCAPPSFSQSKRKGVGLFQIQDHANALINSCFKSLKKGGRILFSTNYRKFNMDKAKGGSTWQTKEITQSLCPKDFEGKWMSRCWEIL